MEMGSSPASHTDCVSRRKFDTHTRHPVAQHVTISQSKQLQHDVEITAGCLWAAENT